MEHPHSATVRTAIELKRAIDNAAVYLQPIGFCPTLIDAWRTYHDGSYEPDADVDDDEEEQGDEERIRPYKTLMEELDDLKDEHSSPAFIGDLETPFKLTVTRPTCEFAGEIVPRKEIPRPWGRSESEKAVIEQEEAKQKSDDEARAALLKKWFDGGMVSGYGDVTAQETKIDPTVRDAREIPASEFSVEPDLLDKIKTFWGAHFFPTLVRVEPYKIHVYGPGGKFKEHRDTPETDLVGTFLVGLGDSTREYEGALAVKSIRGWEHCKAHPGSWVAFYPDVRHEVTEVKDGYRAVIAFKIFRLPGTIEDPRHSAAQAKITAALDKMPDKYGMMLEHKYCKGTTQLSGFDAYLFAAAKSRMDSETHLLPVLTKFDAMIYNCVDDYDPGEGEVSAKVFPLTEPHIQAILDRLNCDSSSQSADGDSDKRSPKKEGSIKLSLKGTEAAWIEERSVSNVPFYSSMDLRSNSVEWSLSKEAGAERTGNESRPTTEDSIYLSYAMVVLPISGTKRKRDEENDSA